jgi:maltose O-acetyltransferase
VIREELFPRNIRYRLVLMQLLIRIIPYGVAPRLRTMLYRVAGVRIGNGSVVMGFMRLWGSSPLTIGDNTTINAPVVICLDGPVTIGNGVLIGHDAILATGNHKIGPPEARGGPLRALPIVIEDGVWTGANVLVLAGVTLGAGCVIGGGAVVTKDVPPNAIAVGVPARVVRTIDDQ